MSLLGVDAPLPRSAAEQTAQDYAAFYDGVARRQLRNWLPAAPSLVLDISGQDGPYAAETARAGHTVISLVDPRFVKTGAVGRRKPPPRVLEVCADLHDVSWLRAGSVDAVLAECSALSRYLAVEETLRHIAAVLRPGGSLLLCVDSLVFGLAKLAEQGLWAELADVPSADVVLVPVGDGTITRCFWPEEIVAMLIDTGFAVDSVRPRTVLPVDTVNRALARDPRCMETLVRTEIELEQQRAGESVGYHLVVAATKV